MKGRFFSVRAILLFVTILSVAGISLVLSLSKQNAQNKASTLTAGYDEFSSADAVTADIRDTGKRLVRVMVKNAGDRAAAAVLGRIVADYRSFVIIAVSRSADLSHAKLDTQPIDGSISLANRSFDPLGDRPAGTVRPGSAAGDAAGYYVVQFGGIAPDEWLDSLRAAGVEILQYVPHNAFFVYADGDAIRRAANHSRVRWVGAFSPEHKITDMLRDQVAAAGSGSRPANGVSPLEMTGPDRSVFDVAVFKRADLATTAGRISAGYGGRLVRTIDLPNNYFNVVRIELPPTTALQVADIPDVISVVPYVRPTREDERAAQIVAGNYIHTALIEPPGYNPLTQFGSEGTDVTISMVDDGVSIPGNGGFYITSANTVDGPLHGSTSGAADGHGHLNASIISGTTPFGVLDPTGYNYGLGIAPRSNIINIPFLKSTYGGDEADTYNDTVTTNGVNGVRGSISNNSWGNGTNSNVYDSYTAEFDGYVRDASTAGTIDPISLVFSAGNSGSLGLTRPKVAKNIISVGNSENLRTELGGSSANNIDDLESTSSRGPAADGRVKPDIVAPGNYITGSGAGTGAETFGFVSGTSNTVTFSGGTSHAAPQIAGAAALFTQFWKNGHSGVNPSPALIKAAVINTGQEMNGNGTGTPTPNGNEGWGRINMKLMLNTGVAMKYLDQTSTFSNVGEAMTITGTVADGSKPVRVALVWTDPPGAANASPALVNDLDLTATIGANVYKGNVFAGGLSTTGGDADVINNVENIRLAAGTAAGTTFSITISATALNGDGILGNADPTDQHFALVAYNFSPATRSTAFDFDGDHKADISIFRPGPGEWWYLKSSDGGNAAATFGTSTDKLTPGDFTGDGRTDIAIWRPATGEWFVLRSEDFSFFAFPFGTAGDVPAPGDFDGDGKTDATVFRPSTSTWFTRRSIDGATTTTAFGVSGDVPETADYDGDGKADIAIYRPGPGEWWISRSTLGIITFQFGTSADKAVPGDFTGDGKADVALWRPSTGEWFVLRSESQTYFSFPFGANGDVPAPADFDGDGNFDAAVFRPSQNTWYVRRSTAGTLIQPFGINGDLPVPNAFVR